MSEANPPPPAASSGTALGSPALKMAARRLGRSKALVAFVVISIALGMASTTLALSLVSALFVRPLPFAHSERLLSLYETDKAGARTPVALATLADWRARVKTLDSLAAYRSQGMALTAQGDDVRVAKAAMTSGPFFETLGVTPALGRLSGPDDERDGARVAVITQAVWTRVFGRDPSVEGRSVRLNDTPYTVVGVLPASFAFTFDGEPFDVFIPATGYDASNHEQRAFFVVGRMRPGAKLDEVRTELATVASAMAAAYPASHQDWGIAAASLRDELLGNSARLIALVLGVVGLLLAVACINVGSLLLARAASHARAVAIEVVLGASPRHLFRYYFAEGLLLAAAGAAVGAAMTWAVLELTSWLPTLLPSFREVLALQGLRLDLTTLGLTAAVTLLVAVIFALVPMRMLGRLDLNQLTKDGPTTTAGRSGPIVGPSLVMVAVAFSTALLIGCFLFLRSLGQLMDRDPGFEPSGRVVFGVGLPESRYDSEAALLQFHQRLLESLRAIPGVSDAAAIWGMPMVGQRRANGRYDLAGSSRERREWPTGALSVASPGYFSAAGTRLLAGREFTWADSSSSPAVALVNQRLARTLFGTENPIGARIQLNFANAWFPKGTLFEVVGVVADAYQSNLEVEPMNEAFISLAQFPVEGADYVVRTPLAPSTIAPAIRSAVEALDPRLEELHFQSFEERIAHTLSGRRSLALLLVGLTVVALFLTAVGVHGLVSNALARQSREMATRLALGAQPSKLFWHVVLQTMRRILPGIALGILGGIGLGFAARSQLVDVAGTDPVAILGAVAVVLAIAAMAVAVPAYRAGQGDPMDALRAQ